MTALRRRGMTLASAALVPAFGTLHATVAQAIPLGISSTASVSVDGTANQPIPLTISAAAHGPVVAVSTPQIHRVRRVSFRHTRGPVSTAGAMPALALAARVATAIPLGISSTATAGSGSATAPRLHPAPVRRVRGHRQRPAITTQGLVLPATALTARVNQPIPLTISATADAPPTMAPLAGMQILRRAPFVRVRRHAITSRAPLHIGPVLSLNKPIPITITATATTQHAASVTKPVPISVLARASVQVDATVSQPIPIGRLIQASVSSDLTLNQPIPLAIASAATRGTFLSASLSQPIPVAISAFASVSVDGAVAQAILLGVVGRGSVGLDVTLSQPIPLTITSAAVGPIGAIVPAPTMVDIKTLPSYADIVGVQSTADLTSFLSSLDVTSTASGLTILSSESDAMPNLVHFIKQGDTSPPLVATLGDLNTDGSITPDNLTGCTVTVNIRLGGLIVAGGSCSILDPVNGQVQYNFGASDTARSGDAIAEFKSVDGSGKVKRYPDATNFVVKITPQVGP